MQRRNSLVLVALISCLGLSALCSVLAIRPGFHSHVDPKANTDRHSYMEVLDADARIFLWHHFLTEEECDYIKAKADKRLERSGVVDTNTGGTAINEIRTSDGMFFARAEDPVIEGIEKRLAEWTLLPVQNGEGLQVLRYKLGQKYDAHWDYFFDQQNSVNGGNRYATVLMYLRAADEGGETVFPKVPAPHGINANFSECGKYSLAVKPKLGDAILFHSMSPDGVLEERSMHGACPVIKGEKWSMTKWIHAKHYNMGGDTYDKVHDEVLSKLKEHTGHPHFGEHDPSEI